MPARGQNSYPWIGGQAATISNIGNVTKTPEYVEGKTLLMFDVSNVYTTLSSDPGTRMDELRKCVEAFGESKYILLTDSGVEAVKLSELHARASYSAVSGHQHSIASVCERCASPTPIDEYRGSANVKSLFIAMWFSNAETRPQTVVIVSNDGRFAATHNYAESMYVIA